MAHAVEFTQIIKHATTLLACDAVGVLQIQYRIAARTKFYTLKARGQKSAAPVKIIENLTAGRPLTNTGHHHKRRQTVRVATQPVAEPSAQRRSTGHFRAGHEKRNRRRMVHLLSVHALDEANIIGRLAHVGHEVAHPRAALPVLLERLNRRQHQLALRISRHGAEPFALHKILRHRLAMQLLLQRLVVIQIRVRWRSVHEQINHPLRLGRKMR